MDVCRDPFARQVGDRRRRRGETPASQVVADDPVDLLGHPPVERAQARLDMGERDRRLRRHQRPGQGGIGVAVDEDRVRCRLGDDRLQAGQHRAGLLGVAAAADAQAVVGCRQAEFDEEVAGKGRVVVLAGIDQDLVMGRPQDR